MSLRLFAALVATSALLAGCLIPEHFTAKTEFQPDGSYSFSYVGTVVHGMAAMQLASGEKLDAKENADFEREVATVKRERGVQQASYKGNGRYEITIKNSQKKGEPLDVLKIFSVRTGKDGVITIASSELDGKGKQQLSELGIKLDGTLDVTLPKNAEVLSHNATSTPSFFGLFGTYSWKIGRVDQRPIMKFRLKG